jgi:dTDP-4-dehydrorhamnose reductase
MRKILITGGSGFLGHNLLKYAPSGVDIYATMRQNDIWADCSNIVSLDITAPDATLAVVADIHPDVIIHAAALADPAKCFQNQALAHRMNVDATANIARAAQIVGSHFIFISTDLVYKGDGKNYNEAQAGDCCFYGHTKLGAERGVTKLLPTACIMRIALLFGIGHSQRHCFAEAAIEKIHQGESVNLFTDEYRCPLQVENLCRLLYEAASRPEIGGVYNVGAPDRISRYDFIKTICQHLNLDTSLLNATRITEIDFAEPRPTDCSMNINKARKTFKTTLEPLSTTIPGIWADPPNIA